MLKMIPHRVSLALAVSGALGQTASADIVCEGTYEFFSGKNVILKAPIGQGEVAEHYNNRVGVAGQLIRKPQSEGLHEVEVSQCGRQFTLTQGSNQMLFLQSIMDETLYVAQDIGTSEAELTLRVLNHNSMVGTIAGETHGFTFDYPVAMEARDVSMPDMEGCSDDPTPMEDTVGEDRLTVDPALRREAIAIVAEKLGIPVDRAERYISSAHTVAKTRMSDTGVTEILPGEPGCPIIFEGVKTCRVYPPDTTTIVETNVLLDDDGKLLPVTTKGSVTNRIRVDDPGLADICAPEETLPPAAQRLRMTFFAIEEDGINDVQAMLMDAETDIATRAHYADGDNSGRQQLIKAANEAYQGVGAPVTGVH
ncbi:hypothetical protein [Yoonia sp. MH D7]